MHKFRFEEDIGFLHLQLLKICLEDYFNVGFFKYSSVPILNYSFLCFFLRPLDVCALYT